MNNKKQIKEDGVSVIGGGITNSGGDDAFTGKASALGPNAGFDPILGKIQRRKKPFKIMRKEIKQ